MTLPQFVEHRHLALDLSMEQTYELYGSKKRFTRHMNQPRTATAADVLKLAQRIQVPPFVLFSRYGMCKKFQESRAMMRRYYQLSPLVPINHEFATLPHSPAPLPDYEVEGANP